MADERDRLFERYEVGVSATLLAEAHPYGIDATLDDISDGGCRLVGEGVEACADLFVLTTKEDDVELRFLCRVVRREEGDVGCQIVTAEAAE